MQNKIKQYRKHLGMTQQELSEKIKASRQTINTIEKGAQNPSLEIAFRIAKVFHTTVDELFESKEPSQGYHHYIG